MSVIVLLLFAGMPANNVACDTVDLIEVNHVYYLSSGIHACDQVIFYEWCPSISEYQVRAWRLLKSNNHRPLRDFRRGDWVMTFTDENLLRQVRAASFRERWTQYDIELIERDRLPQECRPGLLFERNQYYGP